MTDLEKLEIIRDFVKDCYLTLGVKSQPTINITNDKEWARSHRSFGCYIPDTGHITVYLGDRNLADFLRTLGHEIIHHAQNEQGRIDTGSGETGSKIENEANSVAGVLLRNYGKKRVEIYESIKQTSYTNKKTSVERDENGDLLSVEYKFDTEDNKYTVIIDSFDLPRVFQISFGRDRGELNAMDTDEITGEGRAIKILKNISEIINDFYNEYKKEIDKIVIYPTSEKRKKVYNLILPKYVKPEVMKRVEIYEGIKK